VVECALIVRCVFIAFLLCAPSRFKEISVVTVRLVPVEQSGSGSMFQGQSDQCASKATMNPSPEGFICSSDAHGPSDR